MTGNVRQTAPELTWGTLRVTCDNSPTGDGTGPQKVPEGTGDMKSIDKLREYTNGDALRAGMSLRTARDDILAYIDAIEREAMEERTAAYNEGYDAGFASADDWAAQHEDAMAEHGWVRLPLDAEGEYIHFGDVLDQFGTPMTVFAMSDPDPDQGDCMLELITDGISDGTWVRARKMRHHHAPTVEDVLREFADEVKRCCDDDATIAEYAARLQLKEG